MRIKTNNQPRDLLYWFDLTDKEKTEFDYLSAGNEDAFFRYKGWVYCLSDFIREGTPNGWDGVSTQSAWDAILVKIVDSESVIVGRAFW